MTTCLAKTKLNTHTKASRAAITQRAEEIFHKHCPTFIFESEVLKTEVYLCAVNIGDFIPAFQKSKDNVCLLFFMSVVNFEAHP